MVLISELDGGVVLGGFFCLFFNLFYFLLAG